MKIAISDKPFEPYQALLDYQNVALEKGKHGAVVTFVGTMRDMAAGQSGGQELTSMDLEHYPGMTESEIKKVCLQSTEKWPINDILVIHRVGTIYPGEAIVLVAVWAPHRAAAYDASRYIINYLKQSAPLWKRENTTRGETLWIAHNTIDHGITSA